MKNILEIVFDRVFSGTTLFVLGAAALGFILIATVDKQQSICYAQGMVRVKTDAGARCV